MRYLLAATVLAMACSSPAATADGRTDASTSDVVDAQPQSPNIPVGWADACAPPPATGDFPDPVGAVIQSRCQPCHQSPPKNHAPFPLLTYEDTQQTDPLDPFAGVPIWVVMHVVIQPDAVPHMPLSTATQLTSTEMPTLDGWLTGCAVPVPEGTGDDQGEDAGARDAALD